MTVIISVEGVLRKDDKTPIPEGIKLFRSMTANYRVVVSSQSSRKEIEHWLKSNFVFDYANLYSKEDSHVSMSIRSRHLQLAQQEGRAEMFIDADPDSCAEALEKGITSILFATPKYFKVSRDIKPWDSLADEQARQKQIIAERYSHMLDGNLSRWE
jgi:hypothetical protein